MSAFEFDQNLANTDTGTLYVWNWWTMLCPDPTFSLFKEEFGRTHDTAVEPHSSAWDRDSHDRGRSMLSGLLPMHRVNIAG
jgi:hypothetical protein